MTETTSSHYGPSTYRARAIPPMPAPPKKRERIGEDLLPFGDYADIGPYEQLCEDAEFVQHQDRQDKSFYETDDWWWDQQRIRFLNDNLGMSVFFLAMPYFIFTVFGVFLMYVSTELTFYLDSVVGALSIFLGLFFLRQDLFFWLSRYLILISSLWMLWSWQQRHFTNIFPTKNSTTCKTAKAS